MPITKQQCFNLQVAVVGGEMNFKNQGQVMAINDFLKKSYVIAFFPSRMCFIKFTFATVID